MSINYQALTGLFELTADFLNVDTLTVNTLIIPNGAADNYVLTSDPYGVASWQPDPNTNLLGDVTGLLTSNTVITVGGSTAVNVHSAEQAANAATNLNTPSTIVKRDASGNIAATTVTASLMGNASTASLAATVTTNANLTGAITSVGNATTASASIVQLTSVQTLTNKTITGTTNAVDANSIRNASTWVVPFAGAAPTSAQVLTYNGTNGVWANPAAGAPGNLTGDITSVGLATTASANIAKLASTQTLTNKTITGTTNSIDANALRFGSTYAIPLAGSAPLSNNVLTFDGTNAVWQGIPYPIPYLSGDVSGQAYQTVVDKINGTAVGGASSAATANMLALRDGSANCAFNSLNATNISVSDINAYMINGTTALAVADGSASGTGATWTTSVGTNACPLNAGNTGVGNTAVGRNALAVLTSGSGNTSNGYRSGYVLTTGSGNTFNGSMVNSNGGNVTTGSNNTLVGANTSVGSNQQNSTVLGNGATTANDNTIQLGNTSVTTVNTSGTVTCPNTIVSNKAQCNFLHVTNSVGTAPPNAGGAGFMTWNETNAGAETDFINQVPSSSYIATGTGGFNFYTQVLGGAISRIAQLDGLGNLKVNGMITAASPWSFQGWWNFSVAQSTPSGAYKAIVYQSSQTVNGGSSTTGFTAPSTGYYRISWDIMASSNGTVSFAVFVNNSKVSPDYGAYSTFVAQTFANSSTYIASANAGQFVELRCNCSGTLLYLSCQTQGSTSGVFWPTSSVIATLI